MNRSVLGCALAVWLFVPARDAAAAVLLPGDILVTRVVGVGGDRVKGELLRVDPTTGAQTLISSGQSLLRPTDVAINRAGMLFVVDSVRDTDEGGQELGAVYRVDPATGAQTLVLSPSSPGAPAPVVYNKAEFNPAGQLLVVAGAESGGPLRGGIIQIDPVSGAANRMDIPGALRSPTGLAVDGLGRAFTYNFANSGANPPQPEAIVRTDPDGQSHVVVERGIFQELYAKDLALVPGGAIYLAQHEKILRLDPSTGNLTTLTSGGFLQGANGLVLDGRGGLLVADEFGGVVRVDLATGTQTQLASGAGLVGASGITLVPLPEPAAVAFLLPAVAALSRSGRPRKCQLRRFPRL